MSNTATARKAKPAKAKFRLGQRVATLAGEIATIRRKSFRDCGWLYWLRLYASGPYSEYELQPVARRKSGR